jgi:hypothetical protein
MSTTTDDARTDDFQEAIRARLRRGFANWNRGYEAWLEWCDTLYEPDAHYNVNGLRLSLQQYKDLMGQLFSVYDIELGQFYNMLVEDGWCAIRYSVRIADKRTGDAFDQMTMEFVNFKDNPSPIGARVVEGWALSDRPLSAH